jgi:hypothetical protein
VHSASFERPANPRPFTHIYNAFCSQKARPILLCQRTPLLAQLAGKTLERRKRLKAEPAEIQKLFIHKLRQIE